jgi:hypothetical protein
MGIFSLSLTAGVLAMVGAVLYWQHSLTEPEPVEPIALALLIDSSEIISTAHRLSTEVHAPTPVTPTATPTATPIPPTATPVPLPTATPVPLPQPNVQAATYHDGTLQDWLIAAGWPGPLLLEATAVALCESGGRPDAYNQSSGVYGLFQLWGGWFTYFGYDLNQWSNPVVNAAVAYNTYQYDIQRGQAPWQQWQCKPW